MNNRLSGLAKRQISRLNALSSGPSALILPQNIARLDFSYAYGGRAPDSRSVKHFCRDMLPALSFYNQDTTISVQRYEDFKSNKPLLSISYQDGTSKALSIANESSQALLELLTAEGAVPVPEQDLVQIRVPETL